MRLRHNMTMGVGKGQGGVGPPWVLKLLVKKVVFSISTGKNQISPLLVPPWKKFGKFFTVPLEKILPTPMNMTSFKPVKSESDVYENIDWKMN